MKNQNKISWVVKRVISLMFDVTILILATMMLFVYVADPISKATTNITEVREEYYALGKEFNVYVWNEEYGSYIENTKATEEEKEIFNNDEKVIELQTTISENIFIGLSTSMVTSSIILFCLIPLLNKNGRTLGKFALGVKVVNSEGNEPTKKQILIRSASFIVLELILSLYTYFLIPLVSLGLVMFSSKGLSIHDLIAKTDVQPVSAKYEITKEEDDEYYKTLEEDEGRDLRVNKENNNEDVLVFDDDDDNIVVLEENKDE